VPVRTFGRCARHGRGGARSSHSNPTATQGNRPHERKRHGPRTSLCCTVALAAVATSDPAAADTAARPTADDTADTGLSIDEVIASGRLDRAVADALAAKGRVDATIEIDVRDVTAASSRSGDSATKAANYRTMVSPTMRERRALDAIDHSPKIVATYQHLPFVDVTFSSTDELLDVLNRPEVSGVRAQRSASLSAMDRESLPLVRQPQTAAAGHTGSGQYVAVLDTGVNYTHADFGSCTAPGVPSTCRVAGAYEMAANDGYLDDDGHGSNVSGIALGVAPGARILNYDVFNPTTGSASNIDIKKAIDHILGLKTAGHPIASMNLSLGSGAFTASTCPSDTIGVGAARAAGIVVVIASGNSASKSGVAWPSCMSTAISVGNVYDSAMGGVSWGNPVKCSDATTTADKVVCSSQSSNELDMMAPGAMIDAAGLSLGGTSMAAPHVAGAAAVLRAAKSSASVADIESALVNTGPLVTDVNGVSRRRLDAYAALQRLLGTTGGTGTDTTPPTVVAPTQKVQLNGTVGTTGVPVTISWSASDAGGVTAYDLYSSTNGGAWVRQTLPTATTKSTTLLLLPTNRYRFTVAARDTAGNWSAWTYGTDFRTDNHTEASSAIAYSTGWTRSAYSSGYNGYVTVSGTTNASATFTFTGRSFAWISTKATNRGQAKV
jgi:subtilisin family serine protease